jgi:hypothetical protein
MGDQTASPEAALGAAGVVVVAAGQTGRAAAPAPARGEDAGEDRRAVEKGE